MQFKLLDAGCGTLEEPMNTLVCTGLRFSRRVDHPGDTRLYDRPSAHCAGLERHIERRVIESPHAFALTCFPQSEQLGMSCRVLQGLAKVARAPDDSLADGDDGPDGYVATAPHLFGEAKSFIESAKIELGQSGRVRMCVESRSWCFQRSSFVRGAP
jgi:hypothetical protein